MYLRTLKYEKNTDDRSADFIMKMFEEKEYTMIEAKSSYVE